VGCHNLTKKPIALSHIGYRIGIDPAQLPNWRLTTADGSAEIGQLPAGFSETTGVKVIDWLDATGSGLAITLGRCAQNMKWPSLPDTIRHSSERTEISIIDTVSIDPVDFIFAEFELWPHGGKDLVAKSPVIAVYFTTPGK
jgi:hypothetical protein